MKPRAAGAVDAVDSPRPGGRERILAAALEILETKGEAALRFTDIAEKAEVAISAITHFFGTREGLVTALHARRYGGLVAEDHAALRHLVETATDPVQFTADVAAITATIVARERASLRLTRTVTIAATHGRPELAALIRSEATRFLDELAHIIAMAQANGLVDPTVPPRAIATFFHAYAVGMTVADLDESPAPRDEIAAVITRALGAFLADPTP